MTKFTLSIDCDSDAFGDEPLVEVAAILEDLSKLPKKLLINRHGNANNRLRDASALALASAPVFQQLTGLDLRNNAISPAGMRALLAWAPQRLRRLDLHGNPLDAPTIQELAAWHQERAVP